MTKDRYVVVKLFSGETIIGTLEKDMIDRITIGFPIQIKTVPILKSGTVYEQTMTSEFCSLTSDPEFELNKNHIVFISSLKKDYSELYQRIIDQMYKDSEEENTEESYVEDKPGNIH